MARADSELVVANMDKLAHARFEKNSVLTQRCKSMPKGLNTRHRMIMGMCIMGMSNLQIADEIGCTPGTVAIIRNSPLFKQELDKMLERINEGVFDAARELIKLREDAVVALADTVRQTQYPVLRFHAAKDILTRTGINAPREVNINRVSYEEQLTQVHTQHEFSVISDVEHESPIEVMRGHQLLTVDTDDDED